MTALFENEEASLDQLFLAADRKPRARQALQLDRSAFDRLLSEAKIKIRGRDEYEIALSVIQDIAVLLLKYSKVRHGHISYDCLTRLSLARDKLNQAYELLRLARFDFDQAYESSRLETASRTGLSEFINRNPLDQSPVPANPLDQHPMPWIRLNMNDHECNQVGRSFDSYHNEFIFPLIEFYQIASGKDPGTQKRSPFERFVNAFIEELDCLIRMHPQISESQFSFPRPDAVKSKLSHIVKNHRDNVYGTLRIVPGLFAAARIEVTRAECSNN